jgi:hypothetical protein
VIKLTAHHVVVYDELEKLGLPVKKTGLADVKLLKLQNSKLI